MAQAAPAGRAALLALLAQLDAQDPEHLPVVPLDLYFTGNDQEDSIAPNQWEYGRPTLRELHQRFQAVARREDVQCVLVGLHPDWGLALEDGEEWPAAENVHILSSASIEEAQAWIEGMEADGVIEGWPYGMHAGAPQPRPGHRVLTVCWD